MFLLKSAVNSSSLYKVSELFKIFSISYIILSIFSFVITKENIESIIYDIENILKSSETLYKLDELTADFNKNKFINYLPEQDRAELKNHILFDRESLIDVIKNNELLFIFNCPFRNRFLNFRDDED